MRRFLFFIFLAERGLTPLLSGHGHLECKFFLRAPYVFQDDPTIGDVRVRLQSALSDSHLNTSSNYRQAKLLDKHGRIIINSPEYSPIHPRNMSRSNPNLSVLNTSRLSQYNERGTVPNWMEVSAPRTRPGLLGRSAVSYQNISPSGNIFGETNKDSVESYPSSSFAAEGNKCTTNVAWLVGSAYPHSPQHPIVVGSTYPHPQQSPIVVGSAYPDSPQHPIVVGSTYPHQQQSPIVVGSAYPHSQQSPIVVGAAYSPQQHQHHIDILELQSPSHLEVAPLNKPGLANQLSNKPGLNTKVTNLPENSNKPVKMGYSLARSKTVSDIPLWARATDSDKTNPQPNQQAPTIVPDLEEMGSESGLAAGTMVTMGSLKSRIVKHRTLLGSSSRLYKFSQSLSSLTTLGSTSRTSTWDRNLDPHNR